MFVTLQGANGKYLFDPHDGGSRLGQGGMGVVFKGNTESNGKQVAIKVLYKEITSNMSAIERERQSAGIRIDNRNLIKMIDFVEQNGIFHIVSELVEGRTLHGILQELNQEKKKLDKEAAFRIINQVMDGLIALHNNQPPVIHRDIDPSNIMLCSDGTVKIMDFGIAKISDGKRKSLTGMGTVIGKPHYSPPEQIRGESNRINQTTDIYALGITLYEMLTGDPPFNATNEYDVMKMQIENPLPYNPAIPLPVFKVIQKATEKKQERRYASVSEFREALNAAIKQGEANPSPVQPRPQPLIKVLLVIIAMMSVLVILTLIRNNRLSRENVALTRENKELNAAINPITITDLQIGNTDSYNRIISGFDNPLYASNIRYLKPRIFFTINRPGYSNLDLLLTLKYYSETNELRKNDGLKGVSDLYNNYTMILPLSIAWNENRRDLLGFGNATVSIYRPGSQRIEVWLGDKLIFTKRFTVENG